MLKQIQKQLNTIMQIRDTYPSKVTMNRKQYEKLVRECMKDKVVNFQEVLDGKGNPLNPIMGLQIEIDNKTDKIRIE